MGWWFFIDGVVFASTRNPPLSQQIRFEDYVPGILSTLSVNLIDKDTLNADEDTYSGSNIACKARACAFIGISLALGALGGALAIFSLKYVLPGYSGDEFYFGIAITIQNFAIFVGFVTLNPLCNFERFNQIS
ncbi:Transmembrane protein 50A [Nowakowskiella sp. JEL0078]|nr:Transmembrane protein 50A [Nowakowskiella sp. JEL0078]